MPWRPLSKQRIAWHIFLGENHSSNRDTHFCILGFKPILCLETEFSFICYSPCWTLKKKRNCMICVFGKKTSSNRGTQLCILGFEPILGFKTEFYFICHPLGLCMKKEELPGLVSQLRLQLRLKLRFQ